MEFYEIKENKKQYLDLLLLADEQENMIDKYLERGSMFIIDKYDVKAVCIVTDEGCGIIEIKNIAVRPEYQRHGYGRAMINYIARRYSENYSIMQVGTGDSPLTVPFLYKMRFLQSRIE